MAERTTRYTDESDNVLEHAPHDAPCVVYGVTVGTSAFSFLRGQLRWLEDQGWQVKLVASPDDPAQATAKREGVEFHSLPMSREIAPVADCIALWRWLRLLKKLKPEVVNVSTPKAGLLGGVAACVNRIPRRLYVVRGLRLEGAKAPMSFVLWLAEWLAMKVATDVLFVSPSLAREANKRRLLSRRKSWVIGKGSSNGINVQAVEERASAVDRDILRTSLEFGNEDFVVGFVGRIAADKGIQTLIEAFSDKELNTKARLLCIGSTDDEALATKLKVLDKRVRFIPWTNDVWGHLPAIDLLCLPTLREGFPNVVLEAAATGIPAITTRATGAVDSVLDGETGYLIEIGDAASLVEKINHLSDSPTIVAKLGAAAKQRVMNEFQQVQIWQGIGEILSGDSNPRFATRMTYPNSKGDNK